MGRTLKIYLAGILFLVVALVIFDSFKVKPTNWERNYKLDLWKWTNRQCTCLHSAVLFVDFTHPKEQKHTNLVAW